ncbi:DUF4333 domain-containing protein [Nocardioides sp. NPDC047086]|uniref:DUF4333 domain-containing protein n=1 Tax=Nocardioides sp. NPDC047086 TaxID=3154810 RepID=UPI0033CFBD62
MLGRKVASSTIAIAALFGLAACGSIAEDDLEKNVTDQLEKMAGQRPDKVDCPGDLKAEVGSEIRCTLTAGGDTLGLTVTVTSVEGTDAKYEIQVDEK